MKTLQGGGDLSILGPINSYKSVVGILIGIIFLHEVPNNQGIIGIILIIYGSYFVLDTMKEHFSCDLLKNKEMQYRIWAIILTTIEAIFTKRSPFIHPLRYLFSFGAGLECFFVLHSYSFSKFVFQKNQNKLSVAICLYMVCQSYVSELCNTLPIMFSRT